MEMKPEVKKINVVQILITFVLLAILISLVGLYIYYGMYQARQIDQVVEVPVETFETEAEMRNAVLEQLNNQPVMEDERERQAVMDTLMQVSAEENSAESMEIRSEVIEAIQKSE